MHIDPLLNVCIQHVSSSTIHILNIILTIVLFITSNCNDYLVGHLTDCSLNIGLWIERRFLDYYDCSLNIGLWTER
jgi:hypothetical protein